MVAAAHRLASRLATIRSGEDEPLGATRRALRDVISHCLYGVDLNPMAVELCRVSLWMEAMSPGNHWHSSNTISAAEILFLESLKASQARYTHDAFKPIEGILSPSVLL